MVRLPTSWPRQDWWHGWSWRDWSWRDWAVPGVLLLWVQADIWLPGLANVSGPRPVLALLSAGCCAALLMRRTRPVSVALTVGALLSAQAAFGWFAQSTAQVLQLVVAVFACGRYATRPAAYLSIPLSSVLVFVVWVVVPGEDMASSWGWSLNTVWIFALGAAFRHERLLRDKVLEAAGAQARAAAAEERVRVARELHDVLSHSLSVMVVQAEVADTYLDLDTDRSRQAIQRVAETGRTALADTRRIVDLLRDPEADGAVEAPQPGLADVSALVERVRESGLPVVLEQSPGLPRLTSEGTATAYRVVQEALTNVLRHAGRVPTHVRIATETGQLVIEVSDHGGHLATPSEPGNGLRGMRERVMSCGGRLTSGPYEGGFRVTVELPGAAQ